MQNGILGKKFSQVVESKLVFKKYLKVEMTKLKPEGHI